MALILSIDTAMETAALCVAEGKIVLSSRTNTKQTDHAAWMHLAIRDALEEAGKELSDLEAIAVTSGPGSYTGLRVGMSSAKGLCYVLKIPLITETTLRLTAYAVKTAAEDSSWICPMIDARRMEVFTCLYDEKLYESIAPAAMILDEYSFQHFLDEHRITFCGNGGVKWKPICRHPSAVFSDISYSIHNMAEIADKKFEAGELTDLAYSEPFYLKNVYTGTKDA